MPGKICDETMLVKGAPAGNLTILFTLSWTYVDLAIN